MGGLNDQIHIDPSIRQGFEQAGGNAGLIGYLRQRQNRLTIHLLNPVYGATQFQTAMANRARRAAGESGAGSITPTGSHHEIHAVVPSDLHSARVQHRGAQAGEFEHFIAADAVHQLGIRHFPWIRAQHTGHIGEDLAGIGNQGCG